MDTKIKDLEKTLEESHLKREIASERSEEAELKAAEHAAKAKYGTNWRSVMGFLTSKKGGAGSQLSHLYSIDPSLRELAIPRARRM